MILAIVTIAMHAFIPSAIVPQKLGTALSKKAKMLSHIAGYMHSARVLNVTHSGKDKPKGVCLKV